MGGKELAIFTVIFTLLNNNRPYISACINYYLRKTKLKKWQQVLFVWKTAYHEITSNTKSSLILFCKFLFFICFLFRCLNHSPRNNIVWKLTRGYCLCYCKTFSLVPDSTECTKNFLPKSVVDYLYHLKSNNIIG